MSKKADSRSAKNEAPFAGNKILLVDDNPVNGKLATAMLGLLGYKVEAVDSGKLAIERLRQCGDIELILMDCQMPEMDGFEATRFIRDLQNKGEILPLPIVALTANAMKGDRERCLDAGMDDYLTKPLRKDALKGMLAKWLNKEPVVSTNGSGKTAQENAEIPYLDREALGEVRTLMGGKFDSALQLYFKDTDTRIAAIEQMLAAHGEIKDIILQAHSIKSASAHMGAARLAASAGTMEMLAQEALDRHEDAARFVPLLQDIRAIYAETQQNFRSIQLRNALG